MKTTFCLAACFAIASFVKAADPPQYSESNLVRLSEAWIEVAQHITIRSFRFIDATPTEILNHIERESKIGDSKKLGIQLFIPDEFKDRFAKIDDERWTIQLADGLAFFTVLGEWSPDGWMYFPVEPRRIAVIPRDALIRDLTEKVK